MKICWALEDFQDGKHPNLYYSHFVGHPCLWLQNMFLWKSFLSIALAYNNVSIVNLIYGSTRDSKANTNIELFHFNINNKFLESKRFLMFEVNYFCPISICAFLVWTMLMEMIAELIIKLCFHSKQTIFMFFWLKSLAQTYEPHTEWLEILSWKQSRQSSLGV